MMSGNFFGKSNKGLSSSPPSSSSSRRSKRGSEKPVKQPQRELGVAQLEKIRLHEEMGGCFNQQLPYTNNNFIHGDPRVSTTYSSMEPSASSFPQPLPSSVPSYSLQHIFPMGLNEYGTTNIMYRDFQPTVATSWRPENGNMPEILQFSQPNMDNRQFRHPNVEEYSWERRSKTRLVIDSFASQSSGSSENNQEVDLELRLSL